MEPPFKNPRVGNLINHRCFNALILNICMTSDSFFQFTIQTWEMVYDDNGETDIKTENDHFQNFLQKSCIQCPYIEDIKCNGQYGMLYAPKCPWSYDNLVEIGRYPYSNCPTLYSER
jgi:hypothetical protein